MYLDNNNIYEYHTVTFVNEKHVLHTYTNIPFYIYILQNMMTFVNKNMYFTHMLTSNLTYIINEYFYAHFSSNISLHLCDEINSSCTSTVNDIFKGCPIINSIVGSHCVFRYSHNINPSNIKIISENIAK